MTHRNHSGRRSPVPLIGLAGALVVWLALVAPVLGAQEAADDAPTGGGGSAPYNVTITPDTVTLSGAGRITVEVSYADDDGDAALFIWSLVDTDMGFVTLPPGRFRQAVEGTTIPVDFFCALPNTFIEVELVVQDLAGNTSEPAGFTMICNADPDAPLSLDSDADAAADAGMTTTLDAATAIDTGTAPRVVSVEPDVLILRANSRDTVIVTYEDDDGDARRFVWLIDETNAIEYDLPPGRFDQQVVGTDIPITFYCTTPNFFMDILLVVEDAAGNTSEPYPIRLECR